MEDPVGPALGFGSRGRGRGAADQTRAERDSARVVRRRRGPADGPGRQRVRRRRVPPPSFEAPGEPAARAQAEEGQGAVDETYGGQDLGDEERAAAAPDRRQVRRIRRRRLG